MRKPRKLWRCFDCKEDFLKSDDCIGHVGQWIAPNKLYWDENTPNTSGYQRYKLPVKTPKDAVKEVIDNLKIEVGRDPSSIGFDPRITISLKFKGKVISKDTISVPIPRSNVSYDDDL